MHHKAPKQINRYRFIRSKIRDLEQGNRIFVELLKNPDNMQPFLAKYNPQMSSWGVFLPKDPFSVADL
jgi:hypothetical protein